MTLQIALPPDLPRPPADYVGSFSADDRAALLAPGALGGLSLRCRVVMPAMESNLGTKEGRVTPRLIAYYAARARGGVGLVITENTSIHPSGRVTAGMLRIETDEDGAAFAPLAAAVQAEGARFFVQLSHAGRQTLAEFAGGAPWAPSAIPCPVMRDPPRAMTEDDVALLIAAFVEGAVRAQRAGADGVELHAAHGYLLCGFLSPDSNRRGDAWGGDTERRCAFPVAVIRGVKARCGPDFPVSVRISAHEYVEGGITPDEAVRIARRLEQAGADVLHVSACNYESMFWNIPTYFLPEAPFAPLAGIVRAAVTIPVIAVGRLHRPEVAAAVLRSGQADFVAIGRGLIADPDLVRRVRDGVLAEIRPCLACNRCIASINGATLECTVNPDVGFEGRGGLPLGVPGLPGRAAGPAIGTGLAGSPLARLPSGARVVIAGAGVAGMEAALRGAAAGHAILLVERTALGGQLDIAAFPPGKEPVEWYRRWLVGQIEAAAGAGRLEVALGRAVESADLAGAAALIWAAGSAPTARSVPGSDEVPVLPLDLAMREPARAGTRPIVLGGGAGGAEGAHWLAHHGAAVVLVEAKRKIAQDLLPSLRHHLNEELEAEGVEVVVQATALRFVGAEASIEAKRREPLVVPGVTALVLAAGRTSIPVPEALLQGFSGLVVRLGDGDRPGSIFEAAMGAAALFR